MTDLTRTYTADQLAALGVPWDEPGKNYVLARDDEDQHRWYINWRIIFRDPADDTTWAVTKTEDKTETADLPWWHCYDSPDSIIAWRVEAREVTVTQWVGVGSQLEQADEIRAVED